MQLMRYWDWHTSISVHCHHLMTLPALLHGMVTIQVLVGMVCAFFLLSQRLHFLFLLFRFNFYLIIYCFIIKLQLTAGKSVKQYCDRVTVHFNE